jgi:ATP-dependent Clp protease protease subunit
MSAIKETYTYCLQDKFNIEDLEQRKLCINYEIDETVTDEIVYHIMRYNTLDKGKPIEERKPILLYCNSNGGSVSDGFAVIDTILNSITPVYTINLSYQYSMGFLIGLAGKRRYANKMATYLMHDGNTVMWNSMSKVKDQAKFYDKLEDKIKEYILSRSKLTEKEYDEKYRMEWYLFSDEAKEKGFCDFIIGEDCTIDEII